MFMYEIGSKFTFKNQKAVKNFKRRFSKFIDDSKMKVNLK